MRKNYFFETIEREFALFSEATGQASEATGGTVAKDCLERCRVRHRAFCVRLIQDFITPIDREDLYQLSEKILHALEALAEAAPLTPAEGRVISRIAERLLVDPLRFDTRAVQRCEDIRQILFSAPSSAREAVCRCFSACSDIGTTLLEIAVKNG